MAPVNQLREMEILDFSVWPISRLSFMGGPSRGNGSACGRGCQGLWEFDSGCAGSKKSRKGKGLRVRAEVFRLCGTCVDALVEILRRRTPFGMPAFICGEPQTQPSRTRSGIDAAAVCGYWTGLPSGSILWTSPMFRERMPASTLAMSPTTTQTR